MCGPPPYHQLKIKDMLRNILLDEVGDMVEGMCLCEGFRVGKKCCVCLVLWIIGGGLIILMKGFMWPKKPKICPKKGPKLPSVDSYR